MLGVRVENRGSTCGPKDAARADHQPAAPPPAVARLGEPDAPFWGLSVPDPAWVDWSRLDLDEWLPPIYVTGHLPNLATRTDRAPDREGLEADAHDRPDGRPQKHCRRWRFSLFATKLSKLLPVVLLPSLAGERRLRSPSGATAGRPTP